MGSPDGLADASSELRAWLETQEGAQALLEVRAGDKQLLAAMESPIADPSDRQSVVIQQLMGLIDDEINVSADSPTQVELGSKSSPERRSKRARTWRLSASIALSLGGLVIVSAVAAFVLWSPPITLSSETIAQRSLQWADGLVDQSWRPVDDKVLARAPLPEDIVGNPVRWSEMSTEWDQDAVIYDLAGPESSMAMLFVIDVTDEQVLANHFPEQPDYSTGSLCVASSYSNGKLYVLLVEGDEQRYREFLISVWPFG